MTIETSMQAGRSTHRAEKLDDFASARVICQILASRQGPDRTTQASLTPEWGDCAMLAEQEGGAGLDRWLRQVGGRSAERLDEVKRALDSAKADSGTPETGPSPSEGEPWDDPILAASTPSCPFPLDVFPPRLAELIRGQAAVLCSPVDYLAIAALATASVAIGRSVAITARPGWTEQAALYCVLVGKSGRAKSPTIDKMAAPLWRIAGEAADEHAAEKKRQAERPKADQEEVPPLRRTVLDDATIESLGPILRSNPRGIGMFRDELTALMGGMNQYKAGKGNDRSFYLSAWSGAPWSIDRKNLDGLPIIVKKPFLTVIGAMVDSKIAALAGKEDREDGFIQRLLFVIPDPVPVRWCDQDVAAELVEDWHLAIRWLWGLDMIDEPDGPRPRCVRLEPAARDLFIACYNALGEESEALDFPDSLGGAWSKLRSYVLRLALILDRLECAYDPNEPIGPRDVTVASMRNAIRLIDYFKVQARRAYDLMRGTAGGDNEDARAILKWVHNTARRSFGERDAKQNFKGRFAGNGPALEAAIAWLVERRCIRSLPVAPAGAKGGRKPGRSFVVNPSLLAATQPFEGTPP